MIILGIDPGTTSIGYGVIEKNSGLRLVDYGVMETMGSQQAKLKEIDARLTELIKKYKPALASLEKLYFSKNKKTALAVAEARGVITMAIARQGVPIMEFTPNNVKSVVTGYGGSSKDAVQKIVCLTLKIDKFMARDDAADALAIAIRASFDVK